MMRAPASAPSASASSSASAVSPPPSTSPRSSCLRPWASSSPTAARNQPPSRPTIGDARRTRVEGPSHPCRLGLPLQSSLGGGEAGARHPEGRARDVVEAYLVEEGDALRVAAVLPADAELEVRVLPAASLYRHPHELPDAVAVYGLERVEAEDAPVEVVGQELLLGVVAADAADHLGEVVR